MMYSDNDAYTGGTARQETTRSMPGIARRPHGFTSLQLLKQNKEKKARRMQLAQENLEMESEMVNMSTQTDSSIVMLWMHELMGSLRPMVPRSRVCGCIWYDYFTGRHIRTTFYLVLVVAVIVLNLDVLLSICEKCKKLSKF
ncbi:uncharacterized protein LOC135441150 isoform X1 [Drosophila montana]|uniref:uncharacterized protein LOC135441150 isoform X1 n=1 Tax=Drosophila montana TaxID=40370 RepID=UPI00313B0EDB